MNCDEVESSLKEEAQHQHQCLIPASRLRLLKKRAKCWKISFFAVLLIGLAAAAAAIYYIFCPAAASVFSATQENAATNSRNNVLVASEIIQSMDATVDPCEDFYAYACNGWIKKHPIPKGLASWSVLDERADENLAILKEILEDNAKEASKSEAEVKAKHFYRACLRASETSKMRLEDIVKEVGGWNLTGEPSDMSHFDMRGKMLALQKYSTSALFKWSIHEGRQDGLSHELTIKQGDLTLPSHELYTDPVSRNTLKKYITKVVRLLKPSKSKNIEAEVGDLVDFEQALALKFTRPENFRVNFLSLKDADSMASITPTWGPWVDFFNDLIGTLRGHSNGWIKLDSLSEAWFQVSYLRELRDMLSPYFEVTTPGSPISYNDDVMATRARFFNTMNNYLTWSALRPFVKYASQPFRKAYEDFERSLTGGRSSDQRWKSCVMSTNSVLGFALAPAFLDRVAFMESRDKVDLMAASIKAAFKGRIDELEWIDEEDTRKAIRAKISGAKLLLGFPHFILDSRQLDQTYADLKVTKDDHLGNVVSYVQFRLLWYLDLLGKEVDKNLWPPTLSPITVNAMYMYSRNQILLPSGIMVPPFFSADQPMALNYGHLGSFIGHELLHGFDDHGRHFDSEGRRTNWWPQHLEADFQAKSQCLIDQYSNGEDSIDGGITLLENIADNGGLNAAIRGYESWARTKEPAEVNRSLPGLEFLSGEQLLFLGFARSFCSASKKEAKALSLKIDRHSPNHARINLALSNIPKFAQAFSCRPNATMAPQKRCSFW